MKSTNELVQKLARQWHRADIREDRLLNAECWPVELNIGTPTAAMLKQDLDHIRRHISQWRQVQAGDVVWKKVKYRDAEETIELPVIWRLHKPSDWITATDNRDIKREFLKLGNILSQVDPLFHSLLIRQRRLITDKTEFEVIQACRLGLELEQGCANGLPLRTLSIAGIDSKFFERHRALIIKLLDLRFDGLIGEIGLEAFLDAANENDHWLLLADLDGCCIPFQQIRVRASELKTTPLAVENILLVENEKCLPLIPQAKQTVAILGSGLNLAWMEGGWLSNKRIAYWGDIDTWGLTMLSMARRLQPDLTALMMDRATFDEHSAHKAVAEPRVAGNAPPSHLTELEASLYEYLLELDHGRLEQEFLSTGQVREEVLGWIKSN